MCNRAKTAPKIFQPFPRAFVDTAPPGDQTKGMPTPPLPPSLQPFYLAGVLDALTGAPNKGPELANQPNHLLQLAYETGRASVVAGQPTDPPLA